MEKKIKTRYWIILSPTNDADLVELINRIGVKNFRKLARAALLSLDNTEYIGKADEYLKKGKDKPTSYRFQISLTSEQFSFITNLLSHVKERMHNTFIKQVIRYYLGPTHLLTGFLDGEIKIPTKQLYTPLILSGVANAAPKVQRKYITKTIVKEVHPVSQTTETVEPVPVSVTSEVQTETPVVNSNEPEYLDIYHSEQTNEPEETVTQSDEDDVLAMLTNLIG